jgi:glycosyl transferase family 25
MEIMEAEMFDSIEKVVYINLDERKDRNTHVQRELAQVFPADKVARFPAIYAEHGGIGCTKSHIAVLEMAKANGWANVLIVEDDFTWINFDKAAPVLTELLKRPCDAIVLGAIDITCDEATMRLTSCQTTTCYMVRAHYYDTLLANYREGLHLFQETENYGIYALDQHWKKAQAAGTWYIVRPSIAAQRPSYSDIDKRVVNHMRHFK